MQTVVGLFGSLTEANKVKQALLDQGFSSSDVTVIDQNDGGYETGTTGTSTSGTGSYGTTSGMRATGSLPATDNDSTVLGLTGSSAAGSGYSSASTTGATGYDRTDSDYDRTSSTDYDRTRSSDEGVGTKIKHFFQNLTGHDEHTHRAYTEGVSRGGALVAVHADGNDVERASSILRQYGATDIEGDSDSGYGSGTGSSSGYAGSTSGTGFGSETGASATNAMRNLESSETGTGYGAGSTGSGLTGTTSEAGTGYRNEATGSIKGEQVIPVVQEDVQVGKRQVERGGVRVYSHVVSQPVNESVNLHEERVVVDRRPVDRPATEADFRDAGPIEVRATGEEAVVSKTGRVVEEVVVGKTATDRTEQVDESVRRTEVEVEQVGTGARATGSGSGTTGGRGTNDDNF